MHRLPACAFSILAVATTTRAATAVLLAASLAAAGPRPNVLFIAVDDMRPQLGCYGDPVARTPHMDRLAARGLLFERAYCQQALCSPSRISLLSGRYPTTTRILQIGPSLRSTMPDITTLPQHFKNHGYTTLSFGKVYHVGIDDPASWSQPSWQSQKPRYGPAGVEKVRAASAALEAAGRTAPDQGPDKPFYAGPAFESVDCADDDLLDGDTGRMGCEVLGKLASAPDQPFFLAVGFANPHVPWVAPKKYWDLYDTAKLPLPDNQFLPRDAPKIAAQSGADFYWYGNVPKDRKLPEGFKRDCLHGYLAAISYIDAQVGRLLDTLDKSPAAANTIVILWSDHGYYMGEHGWWGSKHNNYEGATRATLMIAVPGQAAAGRKTRALTEFVDIAPSLVDLCGLPAVDGFEGRSFKPLLTNPEQPWKPAAFSFYPRGGGILGTAMRTDRYRYVEWAARKSGELKAVELYDSQTDPAENQNIAANPANAALIEQLAAQLAAQAPKPPATLPAD